MSPRSARNWLWLGALFVVPVPLLALDHALVPVVRYLVLAGASLAVIVVEGGGSVPLSIAGLFLAHAAVYAGLLWLAAFTVARLLSRARPGARRAIVAALLVGGFGWALLAEPYRTPFGHAARGGLVEVLR